MNRKWKVAVAVIGLVLAAGIGYGVRTLARQPLESGIVLKAAWGDGQDQVGVKRWETEPWQGPGTFTTDGARFFLADEVNHRIQVYERGRWVRSIPLPPEVAHIKELCL
ncbi:MAG: hypothetical protein K6T75_04690, partial [Acetobacteraceae bacterium]|nr:hypothetical protein [Acetobacteraceae bacterium]